MAADLIYVAPYLPRVEQPWLHRNIGMLASRIHRIIAFDAPRSSRCYGIEVLNPGHSGVRAALYRSISPLTNRLIWRWSPWVQSRRHLLRVLSQSPASLVYMNFLNIAVLYASELLACKKPLVLHCHGQDAMMQVRDPDDPSRRLYSAQYWNTARALADRALFLANSHHLASCLREAGIPEERIVVKYIGVPVPARFPRSHALTSEPHIVYIGRLVDFKGPDQVIRAFDLACRAGLRARLTVAGDGPLRAECERLVEASESRDRIRLLGEVGWKQADQLRREADIFTAHNQTGPKTLQTEAYGVSLVEAMAAGLPVVTGRSGGPCELIVDGQTGVLVPPGDIDAHAAAFRTLGEAPELRHEMGLAAWRRAGERFSDTIEADALHQILDQKRLHSGGSIEVPVSHRVESAG